MVIVYETLLSHQGKPPANDNKNQSSFGENQKPRHVYLWKLFFFGLL